MLKVFIIPLVLFLGSVQASDKSDISKVMKKVADYQLTQRNDYGTKDWTNATFYIGLMALYNTTSDTKYLNVVLDFAKQNSYELGDRIRHADDHAVGQAYLDLYAIKPNKDKLKHTKETFDYLIQNPRPGRADWWWCDALFMTAPVLAKLAKATKDNKYIEYLDVMWWDTTDFLYSYDAHLYFRDANFFTKKEANGKGVFWSRGNGWVMAALVRVLQELPLEHPSRMAYLGLYLTMAQKIIQLQASDGFWRSSLLDPSSTPGGESSGTAFYVYALSYGVHKNWLEYDMYIKPIQAGWNALLSSIDDNGRLGWVQPIGYKPEVLAKDDSDVFGTGAFLLAGSTFILLNN